MRQQRGVGDTGSSINRPNQGRERFARRASRFLSGIRRRDAVRFGLAATLLFPAFLVLVDVAKNRRIGDELVWQKLYMRAVVEDEHNWHLGWRLEDLARQASAQRARMAVLLETLGTIPPQGRGGGGGMFSIPRAAKRVAAAALLVRDDGGGKGGGGEKDGAEGEGDVDGEVLRAILLSRVLAEEEDFNRLVSVECATRPGVYMQVGMHALVASAEEGCMVYSAATERDPHALFEKIELGEGRFALRAFSNRRFLRVTPPPPEEVDWTVWKVEVGAPEVGLPEVFQMRDGMVYNEVMHGYLSCSGESPEAEVKGFVGEYLWQQEVNYQLNFNQVSSADAERARSLRDLSRVVNHHQRREADEYIASQAKLDRRGADGPVGEASVALETIAVCVPMTSRGTLMNSTDDSPVWTHAFSTFLFNTDWCNPKFRFHWYFGFDLGDRTYDGPRAAKALKKQFLASAAKEFTYQGLTKDEASRIVHDGVLRLNIRAYRGTEHAPSYVVSALMKDAYNDGCDYLYQINDDTLINTHGWAEVFTKALRTNPLGRNVGVTGPADTNNRRILTHAFVHRTHIDIFGRFFPIAFRNWWSDDWISNVYGLEHTLRDHTVTITHDVKSQKEDTPYRYEIDYSAQHLLREELKKGYVELSKWLKAHGMPPPLLPVVCGYSPLASDILKILKGGWGGGEPPTKRPDAAAGGESGRAGKAAAVAKRPAATKPPPAAAGGGGIKNGVASAGVIGAAQKEEIIDHTDSLGGEDEPPTNVYGKQTVADRPPPAPRKP